MKDIDHSLVSKSLLSRDSHGHNPTCPNWQKDTCCCSICSCSVEKTVTQQIIFLNVLCASRFIGKVWNEKESKHFFWSPRPKIPIICRTLEISYKFQMQTWGVVLTRWYENGRDKVDKHLCAISLWSLPQLTIPYILISFVYSAFHSVFLPRSFDYMIFTLTTFHVHRSVVELKNKLFLKLIPILIFNVAERLKSRYVSNTLVTDIFPKRWQNAKKRGMKMNVLWNHEHWNVKFVILMSQYQQSTFDYDSVPFSMHQVCKWHIR